MCGIAGVKRMGNDAAPITVPQVAALLLDIQKRGADATGIAIQRGNEVVVHKAAQIAWKFLADEDTKDFLAEHLTDDVDAVLLHTRAWTKGSPMFNVNNHPLTQGTTSIVHNGIIINDDEIFRELKVARRDRVDAETDSDAIRALLDHHGLTQAGAKSLSKLHGSAAIAAVSTAYPGKLLLARSGSPLVVAALMEGNQLMWASTKEAIHRAARSWTQKWGIWFQRNRIDLQFNPMAKETVWLIGNDGVEWHDEMTTNGRYVAVNHMVHEKYPAKQKNLNEQRSKSASSEAGEALKRAAAREGKHPVPAIVAAAKSQGLVIIRLEGELLPEKVKCPNPECNVVASLSERQRKTKQLWEMTCSGCKCLLSNPPKGQQN